MNFPFLFCIIVLSPRWLTILLLTVLRIPTFQSLGKKTYFTGHQPSIYIKFKLLRPICKKFDNLKQCSSPSLAYSCPLSFIFVPGSILNSFIKKGQKALCPYSYFIFCNLDTLLHSYIHQYCFFSLQSKALVCILPLNQQINLL